MIKIGIFLEGSPKMGGGFFQSLKSSLMLLDIKKYNSNMDLIVTSNSTENYFLNRDVKSFLFRPSKIKKYFSELFEIDIIRELLNRFGINHPFTKFIKKKKFDLIIFLGPSTMAKYCSGTSFIFNIWDLDHKKNTQFPEHNFNNNYEKKEKLLKEIIYRAFKIIVPHESHKSDLIDIYKVSNKQIIVQNFIPMLPDIHKKNEIKKINYNDIYKKFNLPLEKKIIFYPAQFWAHKNHKFIIDAVEILKNKSNKEYFFIFCGGDKGNYNYIKKLISEKDLHDYFKILPFINDDSLISLYLNCSAVIMPTYCGPTNLPIYESFYFKKIIFYTKGLIPNDKINDRLIEIDIDSPSDLHDKLLLLDDKDKITKIVNNNFKFYDEICNEDVFIENYQKIIEEFSYIFNRWK